MSEQKGTTAAGTPAGRWSAEQIAELVAAYRTAFDEFPTNSPAYAREQYERGRQMAEAGARIHISIAGTWSADNADGSSTTAYEKLGFHACTADLLQGWLLGGAEIVDHRAEMGYRTCRCCGVSFSLKRSPAPAGSCPRCGRSELLPLIVPAGVIGGAEAKAGEVQS